MTNQNTNSTNWSAEDRQLLQRMLSPDPALPPLSTFELDSLEARLQQLDKKFLHQEISQLARLDAIARDPSLAPFAEITPKPSTVDNQQPSAETQAEPSRNGAETMAEQTRNDAETQAEQRRNAAETQAKRKDPHPGHHSLLDDLSPELEKLVADTLENQSYTEAAKTLSRPLPQGLGFPVTRAALFRFQKRQRRLERQAEAEEAREAAEALLKNRTATDEEISAAAKHLLRVRLLDYTMDPAVRFEWALDLALKADRLRLTELREKRLALAEKKLAPAPVPNSPNAADPSPSPIPNGRRQG